MTHAILQISAALWMIWVTTILVGHNTSMRIMVRVVPTALAFGLLFFATARLMGWPL